MIYKFCSLFFCIHFNYGSTYISKLYLSLPDKMQRIMLYIMFGFLLSCSNPASDVEEREAAYQKDTSFQFSPISESEKQVYQQKINALYQSTLLKSNFNGSILVAKNGEVVFEDYKGYSNFSTREPINQNTVFHLASVSKTFTGMAIMHLWQNGKLQLNDAVCKYIKDLPYKDVTIKDLLCHRSGLANYVHFMEGIERIKIQKRNRRGKLITIEKLVRTGKQKKIYSNQDVVDYINEHNIKPECRPDRVFKYCNTNYILLAMVVEKITKQSFPTYMKDSLFTPLGMNNTYVFDKTKIDSYTPSYKYNRVPYGIEEYDCIYGDKNVYSTVRDLLLWDKALYQGKFVSKQTQAICYTPYSNERKSYHNYGLGWRLIVKPTDTLVYHNGWWHGNNTVFTRVVKDTATVIVLGNLYNNTIYKAKNLINVFSHADEQIDTEE